MMHNFGIIFSLNLSRLYGKELDPPYRFGGPRSYLRIPAPLISKALKFTLSLTIGVEWTFRGPNSVSIWKKDEIFVFFRELKKEISKFQFFEHENWNRFKIVNKKEI